MLGRGILPRRAALLAGVALAGAFMPPLRPAMADSPATLTDALVEAYNNNATLQEQRAALRQADEQVPTALSGWRPTVQVTSTVGRTSGNEWVQNNAPYQGGAGGSTKYGENRNTLESQVTLNQPVYTGGKTIASLREAKNQVFAARAQLLATEQTVFTDVVNAYVTVITDTQLLALQKSNEQVLQQQLRDTQAQFSVGEITLTSVAQAEASLAQANEQVVVAQGNLQVARENFRQLVGDYPADNLAPPQPLLEPVKSKEEAANAAVTNNPNVIAAEFTDAANKDAVDVAFSALMPQIDFQATAYNQQGSSGIGVKQNGGEVSAQLTVPLYQGGQEYAAIRSARAKEQQSFAAILDAQRTAYQQAAQAWEGLISARAAIVSTNAAIKADAIALDGTEREQLVGTRTTLDVLNAQQLVLNAQVQQVQNIATLVNSSYTVAAAAGRLTARDLNLPVQEYDDLKYYDAVKYAGFGTGEEADQAAGVAPSGALLAASPAPAITDGQAVPAAP
jgi:outer membrane protein